MPATSNTVLFYFCFFGVFWLERKLVCIWGKILVTSWGLSHLNSYLNFIWEMWNAIFKLVTSDGKRDKNQRSNLHFKLFREREFIKQIQTIYYTSTWKVRKEEKTLNKILLLRITVWRYVREKCSEFICVVKVFFSPTSIYIKA